MRAATSAFSGSCATPPAPGRRRCALAAWDPARWRPVRVVHYFKLAPADELPPDLGAWGAVEYRVGLVCAGGVLHCESQFECVRRAGGPSAASLPSPRGADGATESDAGDAGDGVSGPFAARPRAEQSEDGESGGGEGGTLTVVVSAVRGDVIRPVFKTARGAEWRAIPARMSPADLQRCYDAQTAAVGLPYNDASARNMFCAAFLCGCGAVPSTGAAYFCSELVAASLVGTPDEVPGVPPALVSPGALMRHLDALWRL